MQIEAEVNKSKIKDFFIGLYHRVLLSYKSTALGLLLALGADALMQAQASTNPYIHGIAMMIAVPFLAYKDKAVREGTAKLLIFAALFFYAAGARAQTPTARTERAATATVDVAPSDPPPVPTTPQIGGCFRSNSICVGPSLSLTLAAVNLTHKTVEGAFSPGVGVGVTFFARQWYSVGLAGFVNLDPGAQNASVSGMVSILNGYARIGYGKGFIGDTSARLLFGTGIEL